MATIIDALVVTLGLDARDYRKGARDVRDDNKRMRDEVDQGAKQIDRAGQRAALSFRGLRNEVAGVLLAFTGARSLGDFTRQIVGNDAAVGRLASNLGVATEELSAWEGAVKRVGGQSGDIDSAFRTLAGAFQSYQLVGDTGHDADFAGLGLSLNDLQNPATALLRMADAADRLGRPELVARLQRLGLPESTINLLAKGRGELTRILEEQRKLGVVTDEDSRAAQRLDDAWGKLDAKIRGELRPSITSLLEGLNSFLEKTDAIEIAGPAVVGVLGALGVAAATAYGPWIALAGAIGAVVIAYNDLKRHMSDTPEDTAAFDRRGAELRQRAWDQLRQGDVFGLMGTIGEGFSERAFGNGGYGPGGRPSEQGSGAVRPNAGGNVSALYDRLRQRYGKERADGIWRGIGAESNWNPNAFNSSGGGQGAYGLGQWRGERLRRLRARYGRNPTAEQQIEFLMWELEGGDPGGASVLRSGTADEALSNYIGLSAGANSFGFMRPDMAGRLGDLRRAGYGAGQMGGTTNRSQSVTVGTVVINTAATDARGIARDFRQELVTQANTGVTP